MNIWILSKPERLQNYQNQSLIAEGKKRGSELTPVAASEFDIFEPALMEGKILHKGAQVDIPDLILTRQTGMTERAYALLRHLEGRGVKVCNSPNSIQLAEDKWLTTQALSQHEIAFPTSLLIHPDIDLQLVSKNIGYPAILKYSLGSKGETVHLVSDEKELGVLLQQYLSKNSGGSCLLQQYIAESHGNDVRVFVIGGKAVAASERKASKAEEFRSNVALGGVDSYFEIDDATRDIAEKAANALQLDIAGIDLLFGKDGYLVCEVNSSPCFEGFQDTAKVEIAPFIIDYLLSLDL